MAFQTSNDVGNNINIFATWQLAFLKRVVWFYPTLPNWNYIPPYFRISSEWAGWESTSTWIMNENLFFLTTCAGWRRSCQRLRYHPESTGSQGIGQQIQHTFARRQETGISTTVYPLSKTKLLTIQHTHFLEYANLDNYRIASAKSSDTYHPNSIDRDFQREIIAKTKTVLLLKQNEYSKTPLWSFPPGY